MDFLGTVFSGFSAAMNRNSTAGMTACMRRVYTQARQKSQLGGEAGCKVSPLAGALLVIQNSSEKEFVFFKSLAPVRSNILQWMAAHPRVYRLDQLK